MKAHGTSAVVIALVLLAGCQTTPFHTFLSRNGNSPTTGSQVAQQNVTQNLAAGESSQNGWPNAQPGNQGASTSPTATSSTQQTQWGNSQTSIEQLLSQGHSAFVQGDRMEHESRFADAHRLYGHAQSYYQRVLQQVPNHATAHHRLAVIADKQHDFPTAETHYLAAVNAEPHNSNLLSDLGYSYLLQGRYADSERFLQQALQQAPAHPQAINNLGLLYARQGNRERALAMFRRTGTEAEAQAKLAQVLPNAGPSNVASPAMASSVPTQSNIMQGGAPLQSAWPSQPAPPVTAPLAVTPAGANSAVSEETLRLKEMMERARLQGIAERQPPQGMPPLASPSTAQPPADWAQQTSAPMTHASSGVPNPMNASRIPDNQIGNIFREIDQANGVSPSAPPTRVNPPYGFSSQSSSSTNTVGTQTNLGQQRLVAPPPRSVAPHATDSMPPWPQQNAFNTAPIRQTPANVRQSQPLQQQNGSESRHNDAFGANRGPAADPTKQAAYLGMQAGPGQLFPAWNQGTNEAPSSAAPPTPGSFGTNESTTPRFGTDFTPPSSWSQPDYSGAMRNGNSVAPPNGSTGSSVPQAFGASSSETTGVSSGIAPASHQSPMPAIIPQSRGTAVPTDPLEAYERQLQQHNTERLAIQRSLEAQRQMPSNVPQWPYTPQQNGAVQGSDQSTTLPPMFSRSQN